MERELAHKVCIEGSVDPITLQSVDLDVGAPPAAATAATAATAAAFGQGRLRSTMPPPVPLPMAASATTTAAAGPIVHPGAVAAQDTADCSSGSASASAAVHPWEAEEAAEATVVRVATVAPAVSRATVATEAPAAVCADAQLAAAAELAGCGWGGTAPAPLSANSSVQPPRAAGGSGSVSRFFAASTVTTTETSTCTSTASSVAPTAARVAAQPAALPQAALPPATLPPAALPPATLPLATLPPATLPLRGPSFEGVDTCADTGVATRADESADRLREAHPWARPAVERQHSAPGCLQSTGDRLRARGPSPAGAEREPLQPVRQPTSRAGRMDARPGRSLPWVDLSCDTGQFEDGRDHDVRRVAMRVARPPAMSASLLDQFRV